MSKRQGKMKGRNHLRRRVNFRDIRSRFLIVCEGTQTEPNYFNRFRVPKRVVKVVGLGQSTSKLVSETIKLALRNRFKFDQVWCVFDRDRYPAKNFCDAINLAKDNGVKVAYSNEAFELWFVLHFQYLDTAQSRENLVRMLCGLLGKNIKKTSQMSTMSWNTDKKLLFVMLRC